MNGRIKKILVVIILLVIAGFAAWYFLLNQNGGEEGIGNNRNLFPFGEVNQGNQNPTIDNQGTSEETTDAIQTTDEAIDETTQPAGPRLRKISNFPTGGFTPLIKLEKKDIVDIAIDSEGNTTDIIRTIEVENQFVRYSDIKNGQIYETVVTPSDISQELLVENFVPNAEYAYFNDLGNKVLFQYWNKEDNVPESYLANIEPIPFVIEPCPYNFVAIELGDDNDDVFGIHEFLNRNPQTRIARAGSNSPGNETSLVTESTITAVKNFQSLYQIDIDGNIGDGTSAKMKEVCDLQQEKIAQAKFDALDKKYTLSGFFLPQNIISVSMNPTGEKLFYLTKDNAGVVGIVRNLVEKTNETIFQSPFTEWTSQWNTSSTINLITKPSYNVEGFSYSLDPETKRYFKSNSKTKGLVVNQSPNGIYQLFNETSDIGPNLKIKNLETGIIRTLDIQTLAEKCTWNNSSSALYCGVPNSFRYGNEYPDTWYQGLESFTDALYKINIPSNQIELISDINREYTENIDIEFIKIDDAGEYLYFLDKSSEHLWSYRLTNA